jgi:2-polyprenyl-3-methyl-5-hydroxy-6-metoxy-1,4-benzoquinol methylase
LIIARITAVNGTTQFQDPVLAYDRLAKDYAELAKKRLHYLAGVEREVLSRVPTGSSSLLDIGAGDGSRTLRIASAARISRIVLAEPSGRMLSQAPNGATVWRDRAEDLGIRRSSETFDVITCLWNVLGHIRGESRRVQALSAVKNFLSEKGRFFLDVTNRYNLRSYGIFPTAARLLHDFFVRGETNGDVAANWKIGNARISTYGHVFTHNEVLALASNSGLKLEERVVIDYETGTVRARAFQGNLLYVFRQQD